MKHEHMFPIKKMCRTLKVSRGGYYAWLNRPPSQHTLRNDKLLNKIKMIHTESNCIYGSPRITETLKAEGFQVSRPRVARLMNRHGIRAKTVRKFKVTTQSDHHFPISPNLLGQDFSAECFGTVWTSDITYIRTSEGWLYLTVILDLYNRQVVGWSMSTGLMAAQTVIPALCMAFERYKPLPGLIFHSDRGVQYACEEFRNQLSVYQFVQSMSSVGNCYDNAVSESFFGTLKKEHVYHYQYKTRNKAKQSIFEYIEVFYNRIRKHSTLGYLSPVQFRKLNMAA
jgi:putative transposase